MTDFHALYKDVPGRLEKLPKGYFRFSDLCDNPPAGLGRIFRNDVAAGRFSGVRRVGADCRSVVYEKY